MGKVPQRAFRTLIPLVLFSLCVLSQGSCTCAEAPAPPPAQGVIVCRPRGRVGAAAPPLDPAAKTIAPGTITGSFSVTSTGEPSYTMALTAVPGHSSVEPSLAVVHTGDDADGVLGVGFSLVAGSLISRCPSILTDDAEIRDVRYDIQDKLCLDGRRLYPVGEAPGVVEYTTRPDTRIKVIGHYPPDADEKTPNNALFFDVHQPSGIVVEYGKGDGGKPLARGGVPRAFLATEAHDGRGNAMVYAYCFADAADYTAEFALAEIRYTSFEGSPALEPSRAVRFVYGTKDPADIRTLYAAGMALQSSLRLDEIQMFGPGDVLVRRYDLSYELGPTTQRTLLTSVEECGGAGACKPPTRFQYQSHAAGFKRVDTTVAAPTSTRASPMLFDIDNDGLDDLVVPDTDPVLSTPEHPITDWFVARNQGPSASPPYFSKAKLAFSEEWPTVANASGPSDPSLIQPELGTTIDYDDNGRTDLLLHDVYGNLVNETVLVTQADLTFKALDTGVRRPFPLAAPPPPPTLTSPEASVHLADLDGDGVADRVQCENASSQPVWTAHLWRPAEGSSPAGFEPEGSALDPLFGYACDTGFFTVDINADGKVDLVVPSMLTYEGTKKIAASTYSALTRRGDGTWEVTDIKLPLVGKGGRLLFLDAQGDGLPDVIATGFPDHRPRTFINTGGTFSSSPIESLDWDFIGEQDTFMHLAVALDYDSDGRQDLLVPFAGETYPNVYNALPGWFILRATGSRTGPTFAPVDPKIPFEPLLGDAVTLADPGGPRVGDVNGDGAADILLLLGGAFTVFENLAADQDALVAMSDGMNDHDPDEAGFVPNVSISYGHLLDSWITNGAAANDPALESYLYLSRADIANDCNYPRRCAVGPRRVVSGYALNDGEGGQRHFGLRYRDGRYDRLSRSFLGFGERIINDLDTGAGTAEFYDNTTLIEIGELRAYPFAGQATRRWQWHPGLPTQPNPDQIELAFLDVTPTFVPTNDGKSYFTLPAKRRTRLLEAVYPSPQDPSKSVEAYVADVEESGAATVLRDTTTLVSDFDDFGNALAVDVTTSGVDLTLHVERTFKNDTARWVLGQLQTQKECSAAAMQKQCRTLTRTRTIYGEVETEKVASDDGSSETQLAVTYERDDFGNVTAVTADDAYGHHRRSTTAYDAEGFFPVSHTNAAGHTTLVDYDRRLGVLTREVDPNQLVTERIYDSLGRLALEKRPDGSQSTIVLSRTKAGLPGKEAWRLSQQTTTTGGADDVIEYDALGRPVRVFSYGPDTVEELGSPPRLMQVIAYDLLSGQIARRSVPISEDTPDAALLFDVYEYDSLGREVRHRTPWNATTETTYDGLTVKVTDPLLNVTLVDKDALGRPVTIIDGKLGSTEYTYGPFNTLYTVKEPGGAITRMTRDALGRVRKLEDPDRGTTLQAHDGFGELVSATDELGRVVKLEYDALGRLRSRVDQKGAELLTTTWMWDTAAHGIGALHKLTSPDGEKTYSYNERGQRRSIALVINGESAIFEAGFTYDPFGHVERITYPSPNGVAPFVVSREHDAHGYVLAVRDDATGDPYWRLAEVDNAGRFRKEVFGNGAVTERIYFEDKQTLKSIVTQTGATAVQKLSYTWDARLNLSSRADALQPKYTTERFRYDALERLTCAYFSEKEDPFAPCALSYDYSPNGNLIFKSDVGVLTYGDAKHPHAVKSAGGDTYVYDAVGNQFARPGGALVTYTPFDLPKSISQGADTVTFGYAGDEERIRRTTPEEETLYFGDLYERVTEMGSGTTAHRFYVHSPERVIAVVTRGGADPGTRYLHADHLGSVDAITNAAGGLDERRSYDPFGKRRSPVWGAPPPASFSNKSTKGFTGHEDDQDLGLVNMKGRVFDPKIGRFLTPDPFVSSPLLGQSWNRFSYCRNNPLAYVDPTGFTEQPSTWADVWRWVDGASGWLDPSNPLAGAYQNMTVVGWGAPPEPSSGKDVGAAAPAVDVGTTGSSPSAAPDGRIAISEEQAVNGILSDIGNYPIVEPAEHPLSRDAEHFSELHGWATDPLGMSLRAMYKTTESWIQNNPQLILDADHNVRESVQHRDHTDMATVLAQITLFALPGPKAGAAAVEVGVEADVAQVARAFPDSALVVRGGGAANQTAARINGAIGPSRTPGVIGFSAQCNGGTCLAELGQFLRNKQLGVTTVGEIKQIGGGVIATPGFGHHVTVTGVTGEATSSLFQIAPNPNPLVGP